MVALEAPRLGLEVIVQTPQASDPAVGVAADWVLAPISDVAGTRSLAKTCEVITFENEFVDLGALQTLADEGIRFRPSLAAMAPLLDKYTQRQFLASHGLPNPPYQSLAEPMLPKEEVEAISAIVGFPLVMKTRRLGYDGQGTFMIQSSSDLFDTWQRIQHPPVLLEAFIPFERELAVMVARSAAGEVAVYPVVETQQVDQVCRRVIAPATISPLVATQVKAIATTLIEKLDFVGVLGIELFLEANGTVLVNEVAPRTHNSGHYTLDACVTSQFAQQLRAVIGQPLGSVDMTCDRALMVNLLGFETATNDYAAQRDRITQMPQTHVHWYGKSAARPGRKLGHVTVCLTAGEDWQAIAQAIEAIWYPTHS
jgi:5-(carboxyamino)imidazole ribonucleotide synthase